MDLPDAVQYGTPEVKAGYHSLVSEAVGAAGDLVDSVRGQLSDSIRMSQSVAAQHANNIRDSLAQRATGDTRAAQAVVSQSQQSLLDQAQARVSQAASLVAVTQQQSARQPVFCFWVACQQPPPYSGPYSAHAVSGQCDWHVGDLIQDIIGQHSGLLVSGPYNTIEDAAAVAATWICAPGGNGSNWWICCCPATITSPPTPQCAIAYSLRAELDWLSGPQYTDLDLYVSNDTVRQVCYYGQLSAGYLKLNADANPDCAASPNPPEVITGVFTTPTVFRTWYNNYHPGCNVGGNATPSSTPRLVITNTGPNDIVVNGTTVTAGNSYGVDVPFDSGDGNQSDYTDGTIVSVDCPPQSQRTHGASLQATASLPVATCNTWQLIQNPPTGTKCIAGPFPDGATARTWAVNNLAALTTACQSNTTSYWAVCGPPPQNAMTCLVSPVDPPQSMGGPFQSAAICQQWIAAHPNLCGVPPPLPPTPPPTPPPPPPCCPQVVCPPPVVNVTCGSGGPVTNISNVTNTTITDITNTLNDMRSTVNNINTTNIDRSITTINNDIDTIINRIRIINIGSNGSGEQTTGHLTVNSDGSWSYRLGPLDERLAQINQRWLSDTLNDIYQQWTEADVEQFEDVFEYSTDPTSNDPYVE